MAVKQAERAGAVPSYTIEDILQQTQPRQSGGSGFRRVLGAVAGGVTNVFAPGIGSLIGGLIGGSGLSAGGLLSESTQFLELQRRIQMEARAFETASAVLKSRHDAAMAAVRNIR